MKIDFETPDNPSQIKGLKELLNIKKPTPENIVLALLLINRIFYENRPGKLHKRTRVLISGTGCHNPTSYKTGETIWWIWRYQLDIKFPPTKLFLKLSHEFIQNGFMKAEFNSEGWQWSATADIFFDKAAETLNPRNVVITGGYHDCLIEELKNQITPLLDLILNTHMVKQYELKTV